MRYDDREQIEAARMCEEDWAVTLMSGAHHFMRADPMTGNEPLPAVAVVFDQPVPGWSDTGASLPAMEKAYDEEARRFADLMRKTMPQGLRDRVAAHLMGDVLSMFVLSQDGLDERDNRKRYAPSFRPIREDMVFVPGQKVTAILSDEGDLGEKDLADIGVELKGEREGCGNCEDCSCDKSKDLFTGKRVEFD